MDQTFAFDVPGMPAKESAEFIDSSTPEGFYPWQVVAVDGCLRVFCKRHKLPEPKPVSDTRAAEDAIADAHLSKMVAENPRVTNGQARVMLGRLGIRRGTDWVVLALSKAKAKAGGR